MKMTTNKTNILSNFSLKESQAVSAEEVIKEIHNFVSGATHSSNINSHDLAKCAIFLLKTIPATKEAVLEYLCNVFDEAVSSHLLRLELENSGTVGVISNFDESIIQDIHGVLSHFIATNPEAWAPIISAWSLDLLGQLSSKYACRRAVTLGGSLTELLQLWMTCRATRTLIDITTQCISTLINSNPDTCIDALLETSVQHSPNFDWVVAHIGSCFPNTIITRVLACGLKDFCAFNNQSELTSSMMTEKKVPKLASVVGILGHLANQHSEDIRKALLSLFNESFSPQPTLQHLATIPFLLQLASMSNMLLRVITTDFVTTLNADILNRMCEQIPHWKSGFLPDLDGLIELVVHLVLRSDEGGTQVVMFLLDTADGGTRVGAEVSPKVHKTCGLILDSVLLELQRLIYMSCVGDVPLLHCLQQDILTLCSTLLTSSNEKLQWLLPIITFVCLHGGESITCSALIHLLANAKNRRLREMIHLIHQLEMAQPNLLKITVIQVINQMANSNGKTLDILLRNLLSLVHDEIAGKLCIRSCIRSILYSNTHSLATYLLGPYSPVTDLVIQILALITDSEKMVIHVTIRLCKTVIKYFFQVIKYDYVYHKIRQMKLCKTIIRLLCHHASVQRYAIRLLIEGVMSPKYSELFGGKRNPFQTSSSNQMMLLEENRKHAVTVTLPVSHSSVFHAGIIGKGLRQQPKTSTIPKNTIVINCQCLLELLEVTCCRYKRNDGFYDGAVNLALLLVETLSSDVMFNGLPWPDEDFIKVTVERDLHIKRCLDDYPVFWLILKLLGNCRPALCYCSVILRAVAAVMVCFWSSCQEKSASNCPKQLEISCKIVDLMALGQLLPPPLSYTSELFPRLTPYEVSVIFYDIWRYMREHVPSPALFSEVNGVFKRDFRQEAVKKFTIRLHYILQNNIDKFGNSYGKFFS